jgi:DNA-directed RNA polymerase specialized sigma24 family protein
MARARRDPSPPPVERPEVVRSRPTAPAAAPPPRRLAATEVELLDDLFGYARRRVADRTTAEDLTVAALLAAGCGTGQRVDRAGAFRVLARSVADLPDGLGRDPDGPAMALFAQALEPSLLDGFERLDLERRRVLTLHYLDRLGPAEMAAVLGTRAAAVQSRLAASLRALERPAPTGTRGGSRRSDSTDEAISAA